MTQRPGRAPQCADTASRRRSPSLRRRGRRPPPFFHPRVTILALGVVLALAGIVTGLDERRCFQSRSLLLVRCISAVVLAWAVLLGVSYATVFHPIGRYR